MNAKKLIENYGTDFTLGGELLSSFTAEGTEAVAIHYVGAIGSDWCSPSIPRYRLEGTIDGLPLVGTWYNEETFNAACKDLGVAND